MYFAVNHISDGNEKFKLFKNDIYNISHDLKVNVIWPVCYIKGKRQTIRLSGQYEENSILRSWNDSEYYQCKWSYTGSSVNVILESYNAVVTAPILLMDSVNKDMLPYNPHTFTPSDIKFIEEEENKTYMIPREYTTDPNSPENTHPIPVPRVTPLARAMPTPTAPPLAIPRPMRIPTAPLMVSPIAAPMVSPIAAPMVSPIAAPISSFRPLSPHITKIVLADAIRKNEVCPITSEDITETNATVTPCGHVFTTAAITHWLSLPSSRGECPVCKQKC